MANITTSYQVADRIGRAAFEQMDTYLPAELISGAEPELQVGINATIANSTAAMSQFTVVALDNNGFLVPATQTGNKAIGVLCHATPVVASDNQTVAKLRSVYWYTGCFNLDTGSSPLVWDASFTTEDQKVSAFRGSPTPTQVVLRHRYAPLP